MGLFRRKPPAPGVQEFKKLLFRHDIGGKAWIEPRKSAKGTRNAVQERPYALAERSENVERLRSLIKELADSNRDDHLFDDDYREPEMSEGPAPQHFPEVDFTWVTVADYHTKYGRLRLWESVSGDLDPEEQLPSTVREVDLRLELDDGRGDKLVMLLDGEDGRALRPEFVLAWRSGHKELFGRHISLAPAYLEGLAAEATARKESERAATEAREQEIRADAKIRQDQARKAQEALQRQQAAEQAAQEQQQKELRAAEENAREEVLLPRMAELETAVLACLMHTATESDSEKIKAGVTPLLEQLKRACARPPASRCTLESVRAQLRDTGASVVLVRKSAEVAQRLVERNQGRSPWDRSSLDLSEVQMVLQPGTEPLLQFLEAVEQLGVRGVTVTGRDSLGSQVVVFDVGKRLELVVPCQGDNTERYERLVKAHKPRATEDWRFITDAPHLVPNEPLPETLASVTVQGIAAEVAAIVNASSSSLTATSTGCELT